MARASAVKIALDNCGSVCAVVVEGNWNAIAVLL
jgi:hypothetical protein